MSITSSDLTGFVTTFTKNFSVASTLSFLGAGIGAVVFLVFMWWAIRKCVRMLMSAFRRGKLSV